MATKKPTAKKKSARGGARPGSGRPSSDVIQARADIVSATNAVISAMVPELIANMKKLADGLMLQKTDKDGMVDYFVTSPDRQANEYLINRVLGKPTERVQHDLSGLSDDELIARAQAST